MATFQLFFQSGRAKDLSALLYNDYKHMRGMNNKKSSDLLVAIGRSSQPRFLASVQILLSIQMSKIYLN